jgi:hypothetical protein
MDTPTCNVVRAAVSITLMVMTTSCLHGTFRKELQVRVIESRGLRRGEHMYEMEEQERCEIVILKYDGNVS